MQLEHVLKQRDEAEAQRDVLLAALERAAKWLDVAYSTVPETRDARRFGGALDRAMAAIDKTKIAAGWEVSDE